jgi:hypothetical protein
MEAQQPTICQVGAKGIIQSSLIPVAIFVSCKQTIVALEDAIRLRTLALFAGSFNPRTFQHSKLQFFQAIEQTDTTFMRKREIGLKSEVWIPGS